MKPFRFLALSVALFGGITPCFAQVTIGSTVPISWSFGYISNDPAWRGASSGLVSWAQIIHTPDAVNVQLNEFRFYMMSNYYSGGNPGNVEFTTALAEWDTSNQRPAGSPLWTSGVELANSFRMRPYTFNTGGVVLDPAKSYALLALANYSSTGAVAGIGLTAPSYFGDTYALIAAAGGDYSTVAATVWGYNESSQYDLAYQAAFDAEGVMSSLAPAPLQAVPEPGVPGLTLALGGFVAYAVWRRRGSNAKRVTIG